MPSIALITAHARFPWFRQIPGGGQLLDGMTFTLDEIAQDCELLVVYDEPGNTFETSVPRAQRMVILSEPPGIKRYHPAYLEQFGIVLGPIMAERYSGRHLLTQPALPWFYGVTFAPDGLHAAETFDSLIASEPPAKTEAISVILSKKSQLPKHRARLKLVEMLQMRLGSRLQVFGRGFRDIADKAEAIAPYAYHLVLENNDIAHFWTEKTADAYLGWALPLFSGAPNLGEYFDPQSFIPLDIADPARAAEALEKILAEAPYAARLPAIRAARHNVLTRYNLFPILRGMMDEAEIASRPATSTPDSIKPNSAFASPLVRAGKAISRLIRR